MSHITANELTSFLANLNLKVSFLDVLCSAVQDVCQLDKSTDKHSDIRMAKLMNETRTRSRLPSQVQKYM